jgi:CRP-like cAMP-binding protein
MLSEKPILAPSASHLRDIKLLKPMSDDELAQLLQLGTLANHEAHANIIIEGELSWGLYLILDGVVGIFKTNKLTGDNYDVAQLRSGSFFGEMSLVDDNPRSATVRALTQVQLFYISKDVFNSFLDRSTDLKTRFYASCIQMLVARLRHLDDDYVVSQYQLWKAALKKEAA